MLPERFSYERYVSFYTVYGFAPGPDGQVAVGTDISGQVNIWIYKLGSCPRRITPFVERRAFPIAWSRRGRLLFASDLQGNEEWQLHLHAPEEGWYRDLVWEEGVVHLTGSNPWSGDGQHLVFLANREDRSRFDVYIKDVEEGSERLVMKGFGGYQLVEWHGASGKLIVEDIRIHEDTTIYLLDPDDGRLEELTPHRGEAFYHYLDEYGNGFFMATDEGREFKALAYYSLEARGYKIVDAPPWDVEHGSVGSHYLLYSVNEDGYSKLYMLDLATWEKASLSLIEGGVVWGIKSFPGRDVFVVHYSHPKRPDELYIVDLERMSVERLTDNFYGGIPEGEFVEPFLVRYESFDGRRIPALVYKPEVGLKKHPVVVNLHGGPESQARPYYSGLTQYLLHRGVAVVQPNFRGSSGYGKSFQRLIRRDWGGGELRDVERLVEYLKGLEWVDEDRLVVMGGSFGGFLTLSCITRIPEYWRAAVDLFGPTNLVTFAKSVPPYWKRYMREWLGDPDDPEDRRRLEERSPIRYVDNVRCPVLVVQGGRDIRVVKAESDQFVEKLRRRGIEVEYIVFEDEGHGFSKEGNRKAAIKAIINFLEKHI